MRKTRSHELWHIQNGDIQIRAQEQDVRMIL